MKEIRSDKPVYLYCQSGLRSGRAAQMLSRKGYNQLFHLQKGFKKWSGRIKTKLIRKTAEIILRFFYKWKDVMIDDFKVN